MSFHARAHYEVIICDLISLVHGVQGMDKDQGEDKLVRRLKNVVATHTASPSISPTQCTVSVLKEKLREFFKGAEETTLPSDDAILYLLLKDIGRDFQLLETK